MVRSAPQTAQHRTLWRSVNDKMTKCFSFNIIPTLALTDWKKKYDSLSQAGNCSCVDIRNGQLQDVNMKLPPQPTSSDNKGQLQCFLSALHCHIQSNQQWIAFHAIVGNGFLSYRYSKSNNSCKWWVCDMKRLIALFWGGGLFPSSNFLMKDDVSETSSASVFTQGKHLILWKSYSYSRSGGLLL